MNPPDAAGWRAKTNLSRLPFVSHLVGGGLFVFLVVSQAFFTPVDLFVHHAYLQDQWLRFGVFGVVYYGFSLVLLRFCVVHPGWGMLYASLSWLLLIIAFHPASPFGTAGMMRRVADPAAYESVRRSGAQIGEALRMAGLFGFGVVQAIFLWKAWRQLRVREMSPLPANRGEIP